MDIENVNFHKVSSIEEIDYDGIVYDLEIENVHSYQISQLGNTYIISHNSELPDIDMDWEYPDRIKTYLKQRYHEDNVAQVSLYGTFSYRNLVKDIGRIYGRSFEEMNKITKNISIELSEIYHDNNDQDKSTIKIGFDELSEYSPTFVNFVKSADGIEETFKVLFGKNRSLGKHAAGICIADDLYKKMPLQSTAGDDGKRVMQTAYTEGVASKTLSEFGFLKFDVLGLSTLRVLDHTYRLISKKECIDYKEIVKRFHPNNIDIKDQQVFKHVFQDGNFCGIFQFTENGIRKLAKKIIPDCFVDIAVIAALYRPGPLRSGMLDEYAKGKHSPELIAYEHPIIEKVLKETYSIVCFQDDFMILCKELGGFTWPEINAFRKSVVKRSKSLDMEKVHKEWKEFENKFVSNAIVNGCKKEVAEDLWKKIMNHAGYSFNRAHSFSYSMISYQTAYLATHYPLEFYTATLSYSGKEDFVTAVKEIRNTKINILQPDTNNSFLEFSIEQNSIRLPFSKIKGMGEKSPTVIIEDREKNGNYKSFRDFLYRNLKCGNKNIINLIKLGAFDSLHGTENRNKLIHELELYGSSYSENNEKRKKRYISNHDRFEKDADNLAVKEFTNDELSIFEEELYGNVLFINKQSEVKVMKQAKKIVEFYEIHKTSCSFFKDLNICEFEEFQNSKDEEAYVVVKIDSKREMKDKNKNDMAFIQVSDMNNTKLSFPIFTGLYSFIKNLILNGLYLIRFYKNDKNEIMLGFKTWKYTQDQADFSIMNIDNLLNGNK